MRCLRHLPRFAKVTVLLLLADSASDTLVPHRGPNMSDELETTVSASKRGAIEFSAKGRDARGAFVLDTMAGHLLSERFRGFEPINQSEGKCYIGPSAAYQSAHRYQVTLP
jgi:hypothetical protein